MRVSSSYSTKMESDNGKDNNYYLGILPRSNGSVLAPVLKGRDQEIIMSTRKRRSWVGTQESSPYIVSILTDNSY